MTTKSRILATLGGLAGLIMLSGTMVQRVHPSVTQYRALADQAVWYHAWGRSGQATLLAKAAADQRVYVESIHLSGCPKTCLTATFLVDDIPQLTLSASVDHLAVPLRLEPGQRLMVVVSEDGAGISASGYALPQ